MQRKPECERYLASRLTENWLARAVERETLAKRLILSRKQLEALELADPSAFHTYGIYLRSMHRALEDAELTEDVEVRECLQTLATDYLQSPGTSHVVQVRQTVNKRLGVAPPDRKPLDAPGAHVGVAVVLTVLAILFLAALVVLN